MITYLITRFVFMLYGLEYTLAIRENLCTFSIIESVFEVAIFAPLLIMFMQQKLKDKNYE